MSNNNKTFKNIKEIIRQKIQYKSTYNIATFILISFALFVLYKMTLRQYLKDMIIEPNKSLLK